MIKNLFYSLLILSFFSSCGAVKLSVKPGASFSRDATLTIAHEEDNSGTVGELSHLLFEKGFNLISYSTAKNAVKYKNEIKGTDPVNNAFEAEIYSIKELNSIYALELSYSFLDETASYYKSFSARVIDLNSGEIVMSANFRGKRTVRSVLKNFAKQLADQIE